MKAWLKRYSKLISVILALLIWSVAFIFISPDALVERVGIGNAYAISFLVSLAAGFSTLTGATAYATAIEFSRGGADPFLLGLVSGIGLFFSDSLFYLLVMRGREALSNRFGKSLLRLHRHLERFPRVAVYISVYLFCAFGPIPNDIIIAVLIIGGYEYRKVWPALLAGDITFMLFLTYIFHGN